VVVGLVVVPMAMLLVDLLLVLVVEELVGPIAMFLVVAVVVLVATFFSFRFVSFQNFPNCLSQQDFE